MNTRKRYLALCAAFLLIVLLGCGGQQAQPASREGVVYLDPNAAPKVTAAASAEPVQEPVKAEGAPAAEQASAEEAEEPSPPAEVYFESRGIRIEPWMEAAPILDSLGEPIGSFEADSCAYIGKDMFYYYPGFELTVNEVDGVNRITAITVADDTITTPQGLRIYDEEEKLLSILGGTEENGIYTYQSGHTKLFIQVKEFDDDIRRIGSMEYRVAEDQ